MSQIKDDLICEIIRISQTNLLGKKTAESREDPGEGNVLEWIKNNAASYRRNFMGRLEGFSATELSEILNKLTRSGKDLSEILNTNNHKDKAPKPSRNSP